MENKNNAPLQMEPRPVLEEAIQTWILGELDTLQLNLASVLIEARITQLRLIANQEAQKGPKTCKCGGYHG